MKVYMVSGMAADHRPFKYVKLPDGCERQDIQWITPLPKESIKDYAARLSEKINKEEPFALIGLSLGGIMVSEIANISKPVCTILISSISQHSYLPPYYKLANKIKLHRVVPPVLFKVAGTLKHALFMKRREDRKLMYKVIWSGDSKFTKWAIDAVLKWRNSGVSGPVYHIHGNRDEVFPIKYAKPEYIIKGGHMLVMNSPSEVNKILAELLQKHMVST